MKETKLSKFHKTIKNKTMIISINDLIAINRSATTVQQVKELMNSTIQFPFPCTQVAEEIKILPSDQVRSRQITSEDIKRLEKSWQISIRDQQCFIHYCDIEDPKGGCIAQEELKKFLWTESWNNIHKLKTRWKKEGVKIDGVWKEIYFLYDKTGELRFFLDEQLYVIPCEQVGCLSTEKTINNFLGTKYDGKDLEVLDGLFSMEKF